VKKTILALSLALMVGLAQAQERPPVRDTWTGPDKILHFGGGAVIGGVVTAVTKHPEYGFLAGCAVGIGKEVADKVFSQKDMLVTCAGAALGSWAAGWMIEQQGKQTIVSHSWEF
jgi:hypothetical protein